MKNVRISYRTFDQKIYPNDIGKGLTGDLFTIRGGDNLTVTQFSLVID